MFRVNVLSKLCTFELEIPVSSPTGSEFPENGPNPGFGAMPRGLNPTYASVVSQESVRIALTLAAFNYLEVKTSDIQNSYLTAPCSEKIWTTLDSEFVPDLAGKEALVVRALYGLKYSGDSFINNLVECMRNIGYSLFLADPDLWFKEETHPSDGAKYYAYFLLYGDDFLVIHHDVDTDLHELNHFFTMKSG